MWRVRFSRVGNGQGSYARTGRQAGGIVYDYRGEGQGAYAPVRRLPRPEKKRHTGALSGGAASSATKMESPVPSGFSTRS